MAPLQSAVGPTVRWWLLAGPGRGRDSILVLRLARGGRCLAVYSSEEEAERFLLVRAPGSRRRVVGAGVPRLLAALLDPRAGIESVALDPPPEADDALAAALTGVERRLFVEIL